MFVSKKSCANNSLVIVVVKQFTHILTEHGGSGGHGWIIVGIVVTYWWLVKGCSCVVAPV